MSLPPPDRNRAETCRRRVRLGDGLSSECAKRRAYMFPLTFLFMARSAELKCPPLTLLGGTRAFAWPTYGLHMNRTQPLTRSDRTATRERRGQRKGTKLKPKSWPVPAPRLTEPGGHEALPPSARGAVARNAIRDDSRLPQRVRVCERSELTFQCVSEAISY